jgi:hypothetical protein
MSHCQCLLFCASTTTSLTLLIGCSGHKNILFSRKFKKKDVGREIETFKEEKKKSRQGSPGQEIEEKTRK